MRHCLSLDVGLERKTEFKRYFTGKRWGPMGDGYLGNEDLFCIVLLCILPTSSS